MLRARALGTLVAALVAVAGVPLIGAGPAHAATYRFWSYWHGDTDTWAFSGVGADSWRLKDGAVEGWRFATSPGTGAAPRPRLRNPASVWSLDACRDKSAGSGQVRAAVVIDFGDATDYANGQQPPNEPVRVWCGVLPAGSKGMDLLNAASSGDLRTDGGMVCGISGFPSRGCGEVVADPTPTRTATPKPTTKPTKPAKPPTPRASTPVATPHRTAPPSPGPTSPRDGPSSAPTTSSAVPAPWTGGPAGGTSVGPPPPDAVPPSTGAAAATDPAGDPDTPTPVVGLPVASETTASGTPWPALVVALLLALLGGATYWRRRSR